MITRRRFASVAALGAATLAMPGIARAQDWKAQVPQVRIGLLGGENEADRLARYEGFRRHIETKLGVPARVYAAGDYAGVMQAFAARQIEIAGMSPAAYAGVWLDTNGNIEPLAVTEEADGSIGYVALMYVRADSGITSLEDMRGKSMAWADPNSASGYLVPRAELRTRGIDPERYFSRTGFAGGHEQAVVAVLNKQYDAGVAWGSGIGEESQGFTRGVLRSMVDKNMLNMRDLRIIWRSRQLANGPIAARKDLPEGFKAAMRDLLIRIPQENPEAHRAMERGNAKGFQVASHELYAPFVDMRRAEAQARRAR
ncbi:MAG: phosphonate ABC transporter substrate-binding protein [Alphaproteobacteria bacterium]|nr:phosphonate ABC transporter substrate-binding protein [Alphaproteobacteria bacterium]